MLDPRVAAVEDNLVAFFEVVARTGHVTALPDRDVVAFHRDLAFPLFNVICGANFAPGTEARRTTELLDGFVARGLPFMWWSTPSHVTPQTEAILRDRGIEPSPEPGMHLELDGPIHVDMPEGVTIQVTPVTSELVAVMGQGFEFPEAVLGPLQEAMADFPPDLFIQVIARLDGVLAGAGTLFRTGTTAGIYNIATVEGARRRGIGQAVTATLLGLARDRGCTSAVLMASVMGRSTYERLGFVEVCQTPQYVWAPSPGSRARTRT